MQPNFIWRRLCMYLSEPLVDKRKQMKKLYIFLLLVGCVFSACDSVKDLQPTQNPNEAIPQVTVNAIKQEFPEATQIKFSTIELNKIWESNFQLKVDRMSAIVNNVGNITETYKQTTAIQLPDNAKTYIETNFAGAVVKNICQQLGMNNNVIGYKVSLGISNQKDVTLIFDATGTLVLVASNDRNGPPQGIPPPKIYFVDQKDLPEVIKAYLYNKHKDYKFVKAAVILQANSKMYSIVIAQDLTTFEYLFDENGNMLKAGSFGFTAPPNRIEDKSLLITDLPEKIKAFLNKEFVGWAYQSGISFSQNGQLQGYNILISFDKKQFSLQFDALSNPIRGQQVCGNPGPSNNKYELKVIEPKDLPVIITTFLSNKHKEFKYIQTSLITEKDKKTYWVTILEANLTFDYSFDDKGKLLSIIEIPLRVPDIKIVPKLLDTKDISVNTKQYLDNTYAGWVFQKGVVNLVDNKVFSYIIVIRLGNDYYFISFDANGNFVAARRG